MQEVKSTDLSNELLDSLSLSTKIDNKDFNQAYGQFPPHPDNDYYAQMRNFDQYWNDLLILSVDGETNEILSISTLEDNRVTSSSKGIRLGDSIDDIQLAYAEAYYTFTDEEQTIFEIGYVDHDNNTVLSFLHFNEKVTNIHLSYAFDRMEWNDDVEAH